MQNIALLVLDNEPCPLLITSIFSFNFLFTFLLSPFFLGIKFDKFPPFEVLSNNYSQGYFNNWCYEMGIDNKNYFDSLQIITCVQITHL